MKINIQAKNLELTLAIKEYVDKKIFNLEKFLKDQKDVILNLEIAKTTNHHKQGDIFKAEINFSFNGKIFHVFSEEEDLYQAIDAIKVDLERQLNEAKDREDTLFRRGARSVKKMMKGLSKRNPFTAKY